MSTTKLAAAAALSAVIAFPFAGPGVARAKTPPAVLQAGQPLSVTAERLSASLPAPAARVIKTGGWNSWPWYRTGCCGGGWGGWGGGWGSGCCGGGWGGWGGGGNRCYWGWGCSWGGWGRGWGGGWGGCCSADYYPGYYGDYYGPYYDTPYY